MTTTFTTNPVHTVKLVDYAGEGYVAVAIDGEEVAYIDKDGINLLPDCSGVLGVPLDEEGRVVVVKS